MSDSANSIDRAPTPRDPGGSANPTPSLIDLDSWPRRQHFVHYMESSPCTYSMTVELDVGRVPLSGGNSHHQCKGQ